MRISQDLLMAAVRVAADVSWKTMRSKPPGYHQRAYVKRSLIEDLRAELDRAGLGDEWRILHDIVRIDDRQPQEAQ